MHQVGAVGIQVIEVTGQRSFVSTNMHSHSSCTVVKYVVLDMDIGCIGPVVRKATGGTTRDTNGVVV